jgi:hypothetical protein
MFMSIPFTPREVRATEDRLRRIYDASHAGLKGDKLAMAAGMLPTEFKRLCELDPAAEIAALKGKADSEFEAATNLRNASRAGDAKASLDILKHVHGWEAKDDVKANFGSNGITIVIEGMAISPPRTQAIEGNFTRETVPAELSERRTKV